MSSKQPQLTTTTTPRVQPTPLLQRKPSHHPASFSPSPPRNGVTQQDKPNSGGEGRGGVAAASTASVSPSSQLSTPITLQPKPTVNALGDKYEQEADQVMRMPEVSSKRPSLMTHTGAGIRRKATKSPKPKSNKGTKKTPTNNLENMELVIDEIRNSGITDNAAVANILANVEAESHFTPQSESLKYRPEALAKSFPKYVKSLDDAKELKAGGEEAIGNRLYGGRMGNAADEGYKFRGRGLIQTTGRDTYESLGKAIGDQELAEHPDKVNDPAVAAKIVPQFFLKYKKLKTKDLSNIDKVNKAVGFHDDPKTHAEAGRRKERAKYFLDQLNQRNADHGKSSSVPTQPATIPVPGLLQTKLTVNSPGDKYEQEADRVADIVMRMPGPMVSRAVAGAVPVSSSDGKKKRVQRQCATCASKGHTSEDCPECKKKKQGLGGTLQRLSTQGDSAAGMAAPPIVSRVLSSPGSPLPADTRSFMESRFGTDFSHVRVHSDSQAAESAAQISAKAYTVGNHIAFGVGYSPAGDQALLAHELTHVLQQSGVSTSIQRAPATDALSESDQANSPKERSIVNLVQVASKVPLVIDDAIMIKVEEIAETAELTVDNLLGQVRSQVLMLAARFVPGVGTILLIHDLYEIGSEAVESVDSALQAESEDDRASAALPFALILVGWVVRKVLGKIASRGRKPKSGSHISDGDSTHGPHGPMVTERKRKSRGADGGESTHLIERDDSGAVISKTHRVKKDSRIVHQHQDHIGKYGGKRRFPPEWQEHHDIDE